MSSTASGSAATAPAPTFSYAQAAKGRAAPATASVPHSNQAASGVSTPAKDSVSQSHTPSVSVNGTSGSDAGERGFNGANDVVSKADPLGVGIEMESKQNPSASSSSLPQSPSFGTASTSTLPKEDEIRLPASGSDGNWRVRDPASASERLSESNEGRRGKKGKKPKSPEKEPEQEKEEVKPEILVAAPPPAVNIWQQRKEAQAAKAKPSQPSPLTSQAHDTPNINGSVSETSAKFAESQKSVKSMGDGDKSQNTVQNGVQKDLSGTIKGQKKVPDVTSKAKEDAAKRSAPRGSRGVDKDEQGQNGQLPPPVGDAISWPTPETALEEEKRKAHDKSEKEVKDEAASNKSRPKEKWMPVPFVPTVNFATPLPTRGGRGRGGGRGGREPNGRGGHGTNGGAPPEKVDEASTTGAGVETRGRGNSDASRAPSLPQTSSKQSSSDARERKPSTANTEKSKLQNGLSAQGVPGSMVPTQAQQLSESYQHQQDVRAEFLRKPDMMQSSSSEAQGKSGMQDRRGESSMRGSDPAKNEGMFTKDNQYRERNDGQSNRGRGNYRAGRGNNHNGFSAQNSQQPFTNGHSAQMPSGMPPRHNPNTYSAPMHQGPFQNQYPPNTSRGGRGNSRSSSIPNTAVFPNRYPGQHNMPPLQTNQSPFDYQMQSLSATPYNPFNVDNYSVLAMVTMQLEYYFSIDNLCKDVFLRKHMDSQGFVYLAFIAGFKRIQALTRDFELIKFACQESRVIDIVTGEDGIERLRRNEGWEKWVLAMEERDDSVRHAGPKYLHRQAPRTLGHMPLLVGNPMISPPPFSPASTEASFAPFQPEAVPAPTMNGNSYHPETPLSAAVPDFAPGVPTLNGLPDLEETFSDAQVAELTIIVKNPNGHHRSSASRTFSNGSIDANSGADMSRESSRQGRTLTNGSHPSEHPHENLLRSRSPFGPMSPTGATSTPSVMWAKGVSQSLANNESEKYTEVRARALRHRDVDDMKVLYRFWAHFLINNFNRTMYEEFRRYALEDAKRDAPEGLKQLSVYYDQELNRPRTIPDTLAAHYIELVKQEKAHAAPGARTPAFARLRSAWRNGALDMKSRKKIDKLVSPELKQELER